ncbi:ATP-dependent helicase [Zobellia amurskyensis]|uniref:DNA 3'-5' helicase n=1 Tax=Zobellia amurskyensis TaxID=248905 RepID=A0A7X2ZWK7_9FLAO|nr:ATP-dependent helicase [Zobellia amurskyensis]MUH37742.1 ATP-dependent helicase [Zobellia amurskyensis]
MQNFNINQKKAVEFSGKHLLVLAGAGTGKTKTIIGRASYLIDRGTDAGKIQILTFTKRAANEIVERVKSSISSSTTANLRGATFHSWCSQLITKFPNLFGASSFTVIDPDDQIGAMKIICGNYVKEYKAVRLKPQQLIDIYSFARNTKKSLTETLRSKVFKGKTDNDTNEEILQIKPYIEILLKAYQNKKMQSRYLDYDDLLLVVANRLQKDVQARDILAAHYEHILIDEMQDTNPLQWDLIKPFISMSCLFCVGDDAQSIYSFRGADFKNVHLFSERVPGSEVQVLDKNYRSTQYILDVSNWLLQTSPIDYNKQLISARELGEKPELINVESQWEEANYISERILGNFTEGNKTFSDHLILSRSQYYTKPLQAVFIQKKIPYVTYGGRKFMESAHIKDVVSLLRVVNNPYDEIAWIRFLTFWEGIGEIRASKFVKDIISCLHHDNLADQLPHIIGGQDGSRLGDLFSAVLDKQGDVRAAVKMAYEEMSLNLAYKYRKDWNEKRKADFPVLEILAGNYASLGEFISEGVLENSKQLNGTPVLESSKLTTEDHKDHVIISTVHSAKGLEADTCFVLNVSPKVYPSAWNLDDNDEIEEDRRVLYVALTRAKNELIITRDTSSINAFHNTINDTGEDKEITSSYFLEELPMSLVHQKNVQKHNSRGADIERPNDIDLSMGMDFN